MEFLLLFIAAVVAAGLVAYFLRRVRSAPTLAGTSPDRREVGGRRESLPARGHASPVEKLKPSKLVLVIWKEASRRPPLWPLRWPPPRERTGPRPPGWRERELELRKLDVRIAKDLFLYEDVMWNEVFGDQPTGIPKTKYDTLPHHAAQKEREKIPLYSSFKSEFPKVAERMMGLHIYELYLEVLKEGAPGEDAKPEDWCRAALKAMERHKRKSGA